MAQTGQGEAIATAYPGLFKDVLEVDLDRTGTDAEFSGDFTIFEAVLDQIHDLGLARGEGGAGVPVFTGLIAEYGIFHPVLAADHGAEAVEHIGGRGGFSQNAFGTGLEKAQGLGFGHRNTPNDGAGEGPGLAGDGRSIREIVWRIVGIGGEQPVEVLIGEAEVLNPVHHGLHTERFVDEDDIGTLAAGDLAAKGESFANSGDTEVAGGA